MRNNRYTAINQVDSIKLVENGPVRATLRVDRRYGPSTYSHYISLYGGLEDRVELRLDVDWHDDKRLLKVAFPSNLSGTQSASFTPPLMSKWCNTGWAPHWLVVDLGATKEVSQFNVFHAQSGMEQSGYNTRDYQIQTSLDGSNWTNRVVVTGNAAARTFHPITPAQARYARLWITTPTQLFCDSAARIYDFQVIDKQGINLASFKPTRADGQLSGQESNLAVDGFRGPAPTDTVATYEIAYGAMSRSIKRDSSFDKARYEVCGHRWADLSEQDADYGMSILNNCKYGWDALDNQLRMTLLRSPTGCPGGTSPTDRGFHSIHYSIYPHAGGWESAHTPQQGLAYNYPLIPLAAEAHPGVFGTNFSFASTDKPNVLIGTIKRAEDSPNAFILRLYESEGAPSTPVNVTFAGNVQSAYETDLIEWQKGADVPHSGNTLQLVMGKYDLRSVRMELAPAVGVKEPLPEDSDRATGGTAFDYDTGNPGGQDETKAFDERPGTKWLIFHWYGDVGYKFPGDSAYAIREYHITSANDFPGRDPKDWQFQGSNDGTHWITVDQRSNVSFTDRFETKSFPFQNSTPFSMYRLHVTNNHGFWETQLADLQMFGDPGTPQQEIGRTYSGTAFDDSNRHPGGQDETKAFDHSVDSKWLEFQTTGIIGYQFSGDSKYAINQYALTSAEDYPGRDPRNWQFQGSMDGIYWVTLDTRSDIDFRNRHETQTFQIPNTTAYSRYRLVITANHGNGEVQLSELELFSPSQN